MAKIFSDEDMVFEVIKRRYGEPIAFNGICRVVGFERDTVSKALHYLYTKGRITRTEIPTEKPGQRDKVFLYSLTPEQYSAATSIADDQDNINTPAAPVCIPDAAVPQAAADDKRDTTPRWVIAKEGGVFSSRKDAIDAATRMAMGSGDRFVVSMIEAAVSVKVELDWYGNKPA